MTIFWAFMILYATMFMSIILLWVIYTRMKAFSNLYEKLLIQIERLKADLIRHQEFFNKINERIESRFPEVQKSQKDNQ